MKKKLVTIILLCMATVFSSGALLASADQVKTTEYLVYSSPAQVSGNIDTEFSIYIGDDLTGISNPVKSIYFVVAGVYTGGGSLAVSMDDDSATAQIFSLPSVSSPTYFEILYRDPSSKINPATAGQYLYTLNLAPTGVTISGLSVKAVLTHRHKPPACGGYPVKGEIISNIYDTTGVTAGAAFNAVLWQGNLGGPAQTEGKVRLQLAVADNVSGPWSFAGGDTCAGSDWYELGEPDNPVEVGCYGEFNNRRYFKYKLQICSNDCVTAGEYTPTVDDVIINWSP